MTPKIFGVVFALLPLACDGRARVSNGPAPTAEMPMGAPEVAELDLSRGVVERPNQSLLATPGSERTLTGFILRMRELQNNNDIRGLFVRLGTTQMSFARAHEIGRLLHGYRKDKPVFCHADGYDNQTLLLASYGCSQVWLTPAGQVDSVGIAAQLLFGKRLLEKLSVKVDFLQVGKFKGASEPFTRDEPSEEARQSLLSALRGIREVWHHDIAAGRQDLDKAGVPPIDEALEDGPFAANDARAKGLVDEIGYADQAREALKKKTSAEHVRVQFGTSTEAPPLSRGVLDIVRSLAGSDQAGIPHVAVLPAIGSISMTQSTGFGGGSGIGEREMGRVIHRLMEDESVRAVVLRIDSPGGSALASDLLWNRLMRLREKKPLVVSVGAMAASGGYYLAAAGTKILVEPTSIIGSIGVVGGKFSVGDALEQVGVHAETVAAAEATEKGVRATYESPLSAWDDATRQRVHASMQATYDLFLSRIQEGRALPLEKIAESAEGKLFAGIEAKERGLVDEIGGLSEALTLAAQLGDLPEDATIEQVGPEGGLIHLLSGPDGEDEDARTLLTRIWQQWGSATLPTNVGLGHELGAFADAFTPLLNGENVALTAPFAILLR